MIFTSGFDPFDFNMHIYNILGKKIWESNNAEVVWDGTSGALKKLVPDGTYTWKIDFKTLLNDERVEVVGHLNMIR